MCSVYEDAELCDWLRWAEENGSSFLKTTAEASLIADLKHYDLLRPVLLEPKEEWPKPARETLCADATDCRGESRLSRSTSTAFPGKKNGRPGTTLLRLSLSRSSARIPRNPSGNCR